MGLCKKCGNGLPIRIQVGDKTRYVSNRRVYCFDCSPLGGHNTRILDQQDYREHKRGSWNDNPCSICFKPLGKSNGKVCRSCQVTSWRRRLKLKAVEYKGGSCQCCGFNKYVVSLEFHHRDPAQKDFSIAGLTRSWERIRNELDKCLLVCANCHAAIHANLLTIPA